MKMCRKPFLLLLAIIAMACGATNSKRSESTTEIALKESAQPAAEKEIEENVSIGGSLRANRYQDVYFAGQPSLADYAALKAQGFSAIVELREKDEQSQFDSEAQARAAGLNYKRVPFPKGTPLTVEMIRKGADAIQNNRADGKVLVHCGSGQRAATWAGGHFFVDHGKTREESITIAQKLGLTNETLSEMLREFIDEIELERQKSTPSDTPYPGTVQNE